MKTRQLGKALGGVMLALSILPASAHFVYSMPEGAAHNAGHLAPALSLIALLAALGAASVYSFRRK
jgi:hypothetical protein